MLTSLLVEIATQPHYEYNRCMDSPLPVGASLLLAMVQMSGDNLVKANRKGSG